MREVPGEHSVLFVTGCRLALLSHIPAPAPSARGTPIQLGVFTWPTVLTEQGLCQQRWLWVATHGDGSGHFCAANGRPFHARYRPLYPLLSPLSHDRSASRRAVPHVGDGAVRPPNCCWIVHCEGGGSPSLVAPRARTRLVHRYRHSAGRGLLAPPPPCTPRCARPAPIASAPACSLSQTAPVAPLWAHRCLGGPSPPAPAPPPGQSDWGMVCLRPRPRLEASPPRRTSAVGGRRLTGKSAHTRKRTIIRCSCTTHINRYPDIQAKSATREDGAPLLTKRAHPARQPMQETLRAEHTAPPTSYRRTTAPPACGPSSANVGDPAGGHRRRPVGNQPPRPARDHNSDPVGG